MKAVGVSKGGRLVSTKIAIVPAPPSFVKSSSIGTTPQGLEFFGKVTSNHDGVITIATSEGAKKITTSSAKRVTLTSTSTFATVTVGDAVEVNGPKDSSGAYTAHQVNLGINPAVIGEPGPAGAGTQEAP